MNEFEDNQGTIVIAESPISADQTNYTLTCGIASAESLWSIISLLFNALSLVFNMPTL